MSASSVVRAPSLMSSHKRIVRLTAEAQDDFIEIRFYTQLADFPEIGSRWPRLFPGCRVRPVERHVLYYRILGDVIEVVRILHERVDPTGHFPP
jgi:plasmid stabilization system protein ParE